VQVSAPLTRTTGTVYIAHDSCPAGELAIATGYLLGSAHAGARVVRSWDGRDGSTTNELEITDTGTTASTDGTAYDVCAPA
jgi:hypothetical protein